MYNIIKRNIRKKKHIKFLHNIIVELHSEIIKEILSNNIAKNKAKLLKKYNRRLKLISY